VHATESTTRPEKAEACAEHLGSAIPGASHINHMPSHTFNRVGRWGDAVRANIEAWHSDLKAEIGEGFAIYPSHNLHMLLFSASYDGQGAIAIQAAKDYAKITPGGQFYHALTLLRFGRFDEVLALSDAPSQPIFKGLFAFARGYAHLRESSADSARATLALVDSLAANAPANVNFRGHGAAALLGITGGILRAELLVSEGRLDEAAAELEAAVALEDGLRYDEPEPMPFSTRHWLGAVLLEADRAADAEAVYRRELEIHPTNGWSLLGLERSLRVQGRTAEADAARADFERAWSRADTWIRSSRF
jgi:tetratricopeptide (TPR) repeat protein